MGYTADHIENVNREGYNFIADEYSDKYRSTTANFHHLSKEFFHSQVINSVGISDPVLDLGCGTGFLLPLLEKQYDKVSALDISVKMLARVKKDFPLVEVVQGSAFALPFADEQFGKVYASLAASFLTKEGLIEINRVIRQEGEFVFSTPSREWAQGLRSRETGHNLTTFINSQGEERVVFSFSYTLEELITLLKVTGFFVNRVEIMYGNSLIGSTRRISQNILNSASNQNLSLKQLPILYCFQTKIG